MMQGKSREGSIGKNYRNTPSPLQQLSRNAFLGLELIRDKGLLSVTASSCTYRYQWNLLT